MKKTIIAAIAIVTIAGCTKSEITENTPTSGEISFSAGSITRVDADDDCAWSSNNNDEVGIFTNQDGESNLKFLVDKDGDMTNKSESVIKPLDDDGTRDYYAYHPFQTECSGTIAIDLTQGYSTPLLWASVTESSAETVAFGFKHVFAKVTFNISAVGVNEYDSTATLRGAYNKADFCVYSSDESDVCGTFSSQSTGDITLTIVDGAVVAYLIPMEDVPSSVTFWITAEGDTYLYSLAETTADAIDYDTWQGGNEYVYFIEVGEKE